MELSRVAFPMIVLPKDDRTDSCREERLGLPYWTMIWAIFASVDVSKYLDILTFEFSKRRCIFDFDLGMWGKMNFSALRPCFVNHLWFVSDFCYVPRRNLFKFPPLFIHCCFCCGYPHCLRHRNKFVYQIVMLFWIFHLSCNMFLMIFW